MKIIKEELVNVSVPIKFSDIKYSLDSRISQELINLISSILSEVIKDKEEYNTYYNNIVFSPEFLELKNSLSKNLYKLFYDKLKEKFPISDKTLV